MPVLPCSQPSLFPVPQPVVVANGVGVDSMALLIHMKRIGWRPDLILHADPGSEFPQTYDYIPVMTRALASWRFPTITVVRYVPSNFKHWPPYYTLEENCFTNGTLPSLAFGFKSCSQKWKVAPQNKYCESWPPAIACWQRGGRVLKLIGYDAGPKDQRRCNHVGSPSDPRYEYRYPLTEIGWDRKRCIKEIEKEGWPVPHKSSLLFLSFDSAEGSRRIAGESSATHRADGGTRQASSPQNRRPVAAETPARPPSRSITEFIREQGLLPAEEIDGIMYEVPTELVRYQQAHVDGSAVPPFSQFIQIQLGGDSHGT